MSPQIREQMSLKTHFQYEFSILGRFGQSRLQRKKIPIVISMQLLRPVFLCFHGQTIILILFLKYARVRTEKLHDIKLLKVAIFV